ncbi:hypothetical protein FB45DRAFT_3276 [Roridomyces roridus]|uniref:Protein kinase domain-containing protein n=1 Tax=Roridomyces roridus TaxID=1738132 RepID=A0AAD7FDI9_9AGAR|nr:hypothetical protein FB45DRAFT_258703 [Roridomyces roridus]KAJ7649795.1 hypothetical protein FB45DRAFT_3276 [Roridomyces roridus]
MSKLVPARLYAEDPNAPPPYECGDDLFTLGRDRLEWTLRLGDIFSHTCRSAGRVTVVAKSTVLASPGASHNGADVVVKWVWSPKTRAAEADFVRRARDLAEMENPSMLHHLPNFLHVEEEVEIDEDVVLRVLVQELLTPLDDSTLTADELAKAFKDIFECYRWLFEVAKILHRDISVKNLMYRRKDGQIFGVLNDFDLAHLAVDDSSPPSGQRIGTIPYMAMDLLVPNPPSHLPRHDLESLFYVLVFVVCQTDSDTHPGPPLRRWKDRDMNIEWAFKSAAFLLDGFPPVRPGFERFTLPILLLRRVFRNGLNARNHVEYIHRSRAQGMVSDELEEEEVEEVDGETLGGRVTFDTFASALGEG